MRGRTLVIPIFGVLMDSLGRKMAMDTACLFFGVGTIMCALSPNIYCLIAARIFAGVRDLHSLLYCLRWLKVEIHFWLIVFVGVAWRWGFVDGVECDCYGYGPA